MNKNESKSKIKITNNNYLHILLRGPDCPGITAHVNKILATHEIELIDVGQSVTAGELCLSLVVKGNHPREGDALKDLLYEAKKLGLQIDFRPTPAQELRSYAKNNNYLLSCVSPETLTASFIGEATTLLAKNKINIKGIYNLSQEMEHLRRLEIETEHLSESNITRLKEEIYSIGEKYGVDLAYLENNFFRYNKRLIVMDMDSTLVQAEIIDLLAEAHNVKKEVSHITEQAMNGEIDFDESLRQRVKMLEGLKVEKIWPILDEVKLTDGVEEFVKKANSLGLKIAVISGGPSLFVNKIKEQLNLHFAMGNNFEVEHGHFTGRVTGRIVNAEEKAMLLELLAQQMQIKLDQVMAVGDGANDIPMLLKAGLGVAFHAKRSVKAQAKHHINFGPMTHLFHFLGINHDS